MNSSQVNTTPLGAAHLERVYLHAVLPRLESYARHRLRCARQFDRQEEVTQDARILAWRKCLRLVATGRDPANWSNLIARQAVARALTGTNGLGLNRRRAEPCNTLGRENDDGPRSLPNNDRDDAAPCVIDAMTDTRAHDPARTVPVRIDYRAWVREQPSRLRGFLRALLRGCSVSEAARLVGKSEAWGTVHRRAARASWEAFQAD